MFGIQEKIGKTVGELLTALDHICRAVEMSSDRPQVHFQIGEARAAIARGRAIAEAMVGPLGGEGG